MITDDNILVMAEEAKKQMPEGQFFGSIIDRNNFNHAIVYWWTKALDESRQVEMYRRNQVVLEDEIKRLQPKPRQKTSFQIKPFMLAWAGLFALLIWTARSCG